MNKKADESSSPTIPKPYYYGRCSIVSYDYYCDANGYTYFYAQRRSASTTYNKILNRPQDVNYFMQLPRNPITRVKTVEALKQLQIQ